jgi:Excalibur calcium-binding domain
MTENSTAGLTMLDAERSVVLTGAEHQDVLREEHSRRVALELVPVGPRLEARLDGQRVGELTALMSQRYGPTVDSVLRRGERPGCVARVVRGKRGVEVELRLPAVNAAGGPPTEQLPVVAPAKPRKRSRTPLWVGVGVVGLLVVIAGVLGMSREGTLPAQAVAVAAPSSTVPSTLAVAQPTATPSAARKQAITTTPKPPAVYYKNCGVALAEGAAPIQKGEPGYRTGLDPDGDGVACPVD